VANRVTRLVMLSLVLKRWVCDLIMPGVELAYFFAITSFLSLAQTVYSVSSCCQPLNFRAEPIFEALLSFHNSVSSV